VFYAVRSADLVEVVASRAGLALIPACGAEPVGELGTIVSHYGMHRMAEGFQEALKGGRDRGLVAIGEHFGMDEAGGAFDGDKHIGPLAFEAGEVLEVHMYISEGRRLEAGGPGGCLRLVRQARQAVADHTAVDG
jgi:hypothetical protein